MACRETNLSFIVEFFGLNSAGPREEIAAGAFEHCNEASNFIKSKEFYV
jgi:hypothetical protein